MTSKPSFETIFLINKFHLSLPDKIPKNDFRKKIALFILFYADCQFLQNWKPTFVKNTSLYALEFVLFCFG